MQQVDPWYERLQEKAIDSNSGLRFVLGLYSDSLHAQDWFKGKEEKVYNDDDDENSSMY